jgi:ABC-2 type transport system ATP-binding protein
VIPTSAIQSTEQATIFLQGVSKSFRSAPGVLRNVDLQVGAGHVFALLGPNGAGKTTLSRILATLLLPDAGVVRVGGCDALKHPLDVRRRLGCSLDSDRSFFMRLSGGENLLFFAALCGLRAREARQRAKELLESLGIAEAADRRVQEYSSGMKQKLSLARALLADPPVLLLDEPTRGLDPLAAEEFRASLRLLSAGRNKTILLVTHSMEEAVELAEAAGILFRGQLTRLDGDWRTNLVERYREVVQAPAQGR